VTSKEPHIWPLTAVAVVPEIIHRRVHGVVLIVDVDESVPSALSENTMGVDAVKPLFVVYGQVQGTKKGLFAPTVVLPAVAFPATPVPPAPFGPLSSFFVPHESALTMAKTKTPRSAIPLEFSPRMRRGYQIISTYGKMPGAPVVENGLRPWSWVCTGCARRGHCAPTANWLTFRPVPPFQISKPACTLVMYQER
jgi:hypothetical protein